MDGSTYEIQLINVIHHINRMKKRNHMVIQSNAKKPQNTTFDKL